MNKEDVTKLIQHVLQLSFGYAPPKNAIYVRYHDIPYYVQQIAPLNAAEHYEAEFTVNEQREYYILRTPLCNGGFDDDGDELTLTSGQLIGYQYDLTIKDINGYGHDETFVLCDYFTDTSALDD